jgi:hypothetical protein
LWTSLKTLERQSSHSFVNISDSDHQLSKHSDAFNSRLVISSTSRSQEYSRKEFDKSVRNDYAVKTTYHIHFDKDFERTRQLRQHREMKFSCLLAQLRLKFESNLIKHTSSTIKMLLRIVALSICNLYIDKFLTLSKKISLTKFIFQLIFKWFMFTEVWTRCIKISFIAFFLFWLC